MTNLPAEPVTGSGTDVNRLLDEIERLRGLLRKSLEFIGICAGGGVSNTDDEFEKDAEALLGEIRAATTDDVGDKP